MIAIAFDCETTSLDFKRGAILEIALLPIIHGQEMEPFVTKIRPHKLALIEDGALRVNGFTREEIQEFPTPEEVMPQLLAYLDSHGGKFYLRGHNAKFDRDFLYHFFTRLGMHTEFVRRFRPELQCTWIKAKEVFANKKKKPEKMNLKSLCEWFQIPLEGAHRALADTVAANKLWDALTAMEGFVIKPELTATEKRDKYLQATYLQINADGSVFINATASKDKEAMEAILEELREIYC